TDMNTVARQLLSGNNFLQIISDIQVNFNNPSGAYGSTITGYRAEIVNKNQVTTVNGGRLGMMNFNGSATIRASVVDSRGRQSDTRDITINV
ncbi:structural protein, partial [Streptococcus pneumoniae]